MKQAKTLTAAELKRVLAVVAVNRHAPRNKLAVQLSYCAGMRVKEIAALHYFDIFVTGTEDVFINQFPRVVQNLFLNRRFLYADQLCRPTIRHRSPTNNSTGLITLT